MSQTNPTCDDGVAALRRLFHDELRAVRFPGVDAEVLDEAAAREVERATAALAAARTALAGAEEEELARAQRAIAYARIYAEDAPELRARLEAIALPSRSAGTPPAGAPAPSGAATPFAPRRRGRPAKASAAPSLFTPSPVEPPADPPRALVAAAT